MVSIALRKVPKTIKHSSSLVFFKSKKKERKKERKQEQKDADHYFIEYVFFFYLGDLYTNYLSYQSIFSFLIVNFKISLFIKPINYNLKNNSDTNNANDNNNICNDNC